METRPWAHRRPQNLIVGFAFILLAIALVIQAVRYISDGTGGLVPFLMLLGGPALSIYYIWYFNFYEESADI
jgi:hypothetical protein